LQQGADRQADDDGVQETREGADDDVLGLLAIFVILDFAKTQDRFRRDQKTYPRELLRKDEDKDQQPLQVTDVLATVLQTLDRAQAVGTELFVELLLKRFQEQPDQNATQECEQEYTRHNDEHLPDNRSQNEV